jgi:hypothetical protein
LAANAAAKQGFQMNRSIIFLAVAGLMGSGAAFGQQLVASSLNGGVYIVDTTTAAPTLVPGTAAFQMTGLGNGPTANEVDGQFYGNQIRLVDLTTGTSILRTPPSISQVNGYTTDTVGGIGYVADNNFFGSIDLATSVVTSLASPGDDMEALAVDVANGIVYGVGNNGVLRAYDIATNTWSTIGVSFGGVFDEAGLAFDPATSTLYLLNFDGNLYSVNPGTGAAALIGNVGLPGGFDSFGLTWTGTGAAPIAQGVQLDAVPGAPVVYAEEINATPGAPATLLNPAGALNLSANLGYSFSPGEVRYARFECDNGLAFDAGSTAVYDGAGDASLGAINGLGDSAMYFSITANNNSVVAADRLVVTGERQISGTDDVRCTYSLYDFPSQAGTGGSSGRVYTVNGPYVRFAPSYALEVDAQGNPVADVESADPSFSEFVLAPPTNSVLRGRIGAFSYGEVQDVTGAVQPLSPAGVAVTLVDLMDADTAMLFAGDFSAASAVFFSSAADCAVNVQPADDFSELEAVFTIGSNDTLAHQLCFATDGVAIPVSDYTVALDAVSATPADYVVTDRGPLDLGRITRNGTQLQAPLAQVPAGYLSRMVLTNTGSQPRGYVIEVMGETGNVISTANLTGTVPAAGTLVVDLNSVLTGFTAAPRATLNVTVSAPNKQIQGLYQIVNPNSGTVSNHVMVRPGLN